MSTGRTVAVVVLGILLTLTLSVGNVVFAAHATVLDPDFATNTIEEEDGYEVLADQFEQEMAADGGADGAGDDGASTSQASSMSEFLEGEGVFEDAVTTEYMAAQMEPNVYRTYAYLHGNEPRLNLSLDAEPIAENAGTAADDAVANATTVELLALTGGDPLQDLPVEESTIEMLDEGPDAYEQAQQDVRDRVYQEVLDEAVEQAYQDRSNDELLALVIPDYDPNDYSESEKEQMVQEREGDIKSALRASIEDERGDELESEVDDRLVSLREDATSDDVSTGQDSFDGPATDLRDTTVAALTTDMSYETYQDDAGAAKAELGAAVGEYTESALAEELGSTVDLNEAMGIPEEGAFGDAVSTVTWLDRLALVIPVVAIGLIGLVYYLTRSVGRTVGTVGWSLLWAAIPAFVGATLLAGRLPGMMGVEGDPNAMSSVILGLFQRTLGHLAAQSLAIGLVGGLFVGSAIGHRYGAFDRYLDTGPETAEGEAVETESESDPLADRGGGEDAPTGAGSGTDVGTDASAQTDSTDSGTAQQDDR